jgi:catechol 2,3-dioxygenase-like lactoylglutathione lyase family enzyme
MAGDSPGSADGLGAEPFLSIHAVRIFVHDVDRSLHFYLDQLGFRLVVDTRLQSGERWVAVSPPDGDAILTLVAPRPKRSSTSSSAGPRKWSSLPPT